MIGLLALLTLSMGSGDGEMSPPPPLAPGSEMDGDQVTFQKEVAEDRRSLFDGVRYYQSPETVGVGDTLEFSARLLATGNGAPPECRCPAQW
ncbi:hypothetical protein Slala04_32500 [Streptomyces lavendulae subsp. lavendulae]|nr:hypothetical protein Slala04_32500 [Streptomyces lavendulae subsp. lavendulae]